MKDYNIKSFLQRRSGSILFGITFFILIGFIMSQTTRAVNEIKQNQYDNSEKLLTVLSRLETQGQRIQGLQEQNNELQQLSICLLQLIKGSGFTDREECQAKVDNFEQSNGIFKENPQPQSNPQPNPQPPPPPSQGLIPDGVPIIGGI